MMAQRYHFLYDESQSVRSSMLEVQSSKFKVAVFYTGAIIIIKKVLFFYIENFVPIGDKSLISFIIYHLSIVHHPLSIILCPLNNALTIHYSLLTTHSYL